MSSAQDFMLHLVIVVGCGVAICFLLQTLWEEVLFPWWPSHWWPFTEIELVKPPDDDDDEEEEDDE